MSRKVKLYPSTTIVSQPLHLSRVKKYDFKDGRGPVDASRHPNGGGLLGIDSLAAKTVKIFRRAKVFDKSELNGFGIISDYAQVSRTKGEGDYELSEDSRVQKSQLYGHEGKKVTISDGSQVTASLLIGGPLTLWDGAIVKNCTLQGRIFIDHAKLLHQVIILKGKNLFMNGHEIDRTFSDRTFPGIKGKVSFKIDDTTNEAILEIIGETVKAITTRPQKK